MWHYRTEQGLQREVRILLDNKLSHKYWKRSDHIAYCGSDSDKFHTVYILNKIEYVIMLNDSV